MSNKKKKEPPFNFYKFVDEAFGYCVIAIGKGDFRTQFWSFMQSLAIAKYEEGRKYGYQQAIDEQKEKAKTR